MRAKGDKLSLHAGVLSLFFRGSVTGAWAFKRVGLAATRPLAFIPSLLAAPPLFADLRALRLGGRLSH